MLEVDHCSYSFVDGESVIQNASLYVKPGEMVALVGENGSGKSTLARLMCAMRLPHDGRLAVDGHDPAASDTEREEARRLVGFVQQDPVDQLVSTVVYDDVAFGPRNLGLGPQEVRERVFQALTMVGLAWAVDREVTDLSGGEQQRLALAGVLAMRPRYVILDEVTSQIDSALRPTFRALLTDLAHDHGLGVVLVTHDPIEICAVDRVVLLKAGKIEWAGTPEESFSSYPSLWDDLVLQTAYTKALRVALHEGAPYSLVKTPRQFCQWLEAAQRASGGASRAVRAVLESLQNGFSASNASVCSIDLPSGYDSYAARGCDQDGLVLSNVGYRYEGSPVAALSHVDLEVRAGEVLLVAGPSGSGKSTLACVASGLYDASEGSVVLNGEPVTPSRCGVAFQRPEDQLFQMTVKDELAFAPRNAGIDEAGVESAVGGASMRVGLDHSMLEASPFEISGGQARRVGLGCILTMDVCACILDEPTAGLDAPGRRDLHKLARELARDGMPVIIISHDLDEWLLDVDRVALMRDGSISWTGRPGELLGHPSHFASAGIAAPESVQLLLASGLINEAACDSRVPAEPRPVEVSLPQDSSMGSKGQSFVASLDARVKILLLLALTAAAFIAQGPAMLIVGYAALAACLMAARIDPRSIARVARPVALILAFTLLANLVSCDGTAPLPLAGGVGINVEGGIRGLFAVSRIILLLGFSLVVSKTTTPPQLSDSCVRLLRPLERVGAPIKEVGSVLSIALRFIPVVSDEFERCHLAQRARGVQFEEGGVVTRLHRWASVLTPLVIGLFRRSDRLADSMAARCYADGAGVLVDPEPLVARDWMALAAGFALVVAMMAL